MSVRLRVGCLDGRRRFARGCGSSSPTSPSSSSRQISIAVAFNGAPFTATVEGKSVSADGIFTFDVTPGEHEISVTFTSGLLIVAFAGGQFGRGGVKSGSLISLQGVEPLVQQCGAGWGDFIRRQQSFRLRFTVTADSLSACQ